MGKDTDIGWCHHTLNPWWGCHRVSAGCERCYAQTFDRRVHGRDTTHWDLRGERRFFGDKYWHQVISWNRAAKKAGERRRVFVGSMCDWAEIHPDPDTNAKMNACRARLWEMIAGCEWLDFLLLTKRIENVRQFLPGPVTSVAGHRPQWSVLPWNNVWIGTTVENQEYADKRLPQLLAIPAVVRFLSCEPLLGPIDLTMFFADATCRRGLPWVIVGAESGGRARPCETAWIRSIRDQCLAAGAPLFLKQAVADLSIPQPFRPIRLGAGSFDKGKVKGSPMIEMPYLDGHQYVQFPEVTP